MNGKDGNLYQICRKLTGFTQECAAERLDIDVRTLSNYENKRTDDESPVPEKVIARMAEEYGIPSLPFYHVKYYTPLGKFFPDYIEPDGMGDMAFQGIMARDELVKTIDRFTGIAKECKKGIPPEKADEYAECMDWFKSIGGTIMSIEAYGRRQVCGEKQSEEVAA